MPSYSSSLKSWGSTGQEYPDNYDYVEGEQPVDAWDNFQVSNAIDDILHLVNVTNNELIARDGSVAMTAALPMAGNTLSNVGDINDNGGNLVYDITNNFVPQARLENDSITVTAGDGLKNGGSVALGGTTTVDVEPADFAGTYLSDDGSDNLQVDISNHLQNDGSGNIEVADDFVLNTGDNIAGDLDIRGAQLNNPYNDGTIVCEQLRENRFGAEGSKISQQSWATVPNSDLVFDPDTFKDRNGEVYIRLVYHLKHWTDSGTVSARLYRQNAQSAVNGSKTNVDDTTVSLSLNDAWGTADTGWLQLSGDAGMESYQVQMESSDGNDVEYNSIRIIWGVPQ